MSQSVSPLRNWLHAFVPHALNTRPREWLRAGLGACLALTVATWLCQRLFGSEVAMHLFGPLAASSVLLFAVSSGALAQPWSIVGSYLCATLVAVLLGWWLGHGLPVAALAVGVSICVMCLLRCLHPPGGAVALCVVLGGPAIEALHLAVLAPVMLNAACLLGCALLYNNLTLVRYPRAQAAGMADQHGTADRPVLQRLGVSGEDLDQALDEFGAFVDITRDDLERIIRRTEQNALRRSMGDIRARQIMSRDVRSATPQTTVAQALRLLQKHHLKVLPVLDEQRQLVGVVSLTDLLGRARQPGLLGRLGLRHDVAVAQLMTSPVVSVDADTHLVDLIPLLAGQGLHCLPVMEGGELVGVITQTDLIAGLHRDLLGNLKVAELRAAS